MEVIILVTDIHRTRSWTNVAFQGSEVAARASFRLEEDASGDGVTINSRLSCERNQRWC